MIASVGEERSIPFGQGAGLGAGLSREEDEISLLLRLKSG